MSTTMAGESAPTAGNRSVEIDGETSGSEESRTKGMEFLGRISARTVDRDEPADLATRDAQLEAITRWGIPDPSKLARLGAITQPTLVANGDNDR